MSSIIIACFIIFSTMLLGALTLAMLLPIHELNFISDVARLFQQFFIHQGHPALAKFINGLIVIGCLGCANNWLLAPATGLQFAFAKMSKQTPSINSLLLIQALSIALLSAVFLAFKQITSGYWFMLVLATQMYLLMYVLMFVAAFNYARTQKDKNQFIITIVSVLGLSGVITAILISFKLPSNITISHPLIYQLSLGILFVLSTLPILKSSRLLPSRR